MRIYYKKKFWAGVGALLLGHACLGPELPYTVFHGLSPLSINVKVPSREASFT